MNNLPSLKKVEFSKRDLQVIELLLMGKSNKQIAFQLKISVRAIEQHLTHIYEVLGVHSRAEAIIKLIQAHEQ